jgi:phosphatidylinositol alpha-mannosyltransferase
VTPLPQFNDGKLNIIFLGRISEPRKGLKFLIRAFSLIKQQLPNVRLIIVGKGKESGYRRYLEKYDIRDVVFTGFVSEEDKPRYYHSAHVFCAPAIGSESFGITLIEAMASGLPIVASDIPGYASVLQHGKQGFLVEPKNKEALALSLVHLLSDVELRQRMSEAAIQKADEYNWPKVSKRVLEFYERAENRRKARVRLKRIRSSRGRRIYGLNWFLRRTRRGSRRVGVKTFDGEAADSSSTTINQPSQTERFK